MKKKQLSASHVQKAHTKIRQARNTVTIARQDDKPHLNATSANCAPPVNTPHCRMSQLVLGVFNVMEGEQRQIKGLRRVRRVVLDCTVV